MKTILLVLFFGFFKVCYSQGPPPPALEASKENRKLITELMKVTDYENYFVSYCMRHIERIGAEKGLSEEKILRSKNKIDFNGFMNKTIFNLFAIYSKEELQEMISLCEKLNTNHKNYSHIFFSMGNMQSNLELEISTYMLE